MRRLNWHQHLAETLQAAMTRPFLWGEHDCCLFAADCVQAMTGTDYAVEFRNTYHTAAGAQKAILKRAESLTVLVDGLFSRTDVRLIQRGDVVLFDGPQGETLGVVWHGAVWAAGERGAGPVEAEIKVAWRVE